MSHYLYKVWIAIIIENFHNSAVRAIHSTLVHCSNTCTCILKLLQRKFQGSFLQMCNCLNYVAHFLIVHLTVVVGITHL